MSTVKIPPVLRSSVGGEKEVDAGGTSVGEVLRSLAEQHPATESQLFSKAACSSALSLISTMRSTPPAPITTGTPT